MLGEGALHFLHLLAFPTSPASVLADRPPESPGEELQACGFPSSVAFSQGAGRAVGERGLAQQHFCPTDLGARCPDSRPAQPGALGLGGCRSQCLPSPGVAGGLDGGDRSLAVTGGQGARQAAGGVGLRHCGQVGAWPRHQPAPLRGQGRKEPQGPSLPRPRARPCATLSSDSFPLAPRVPPARGEHRGTEPAAGSASARRPPPPADLAPPRPVTRGHRLVLLPFKAQLADGVVSGRPHTSSRCNSRPRGAPRGTRRELGAEGRAVPGPGCGSQRGVTSLPPGPGPSAEVLPPPGWRGGSAPAWGRGCGERGHLLAVSSLTPPPSPAPPTPLGDGTRHLKYCVCLENGPMFPPGRQRFAACSLGRNLTGCRARHARPGGEEAARPAWLSD